MEHVCCAPYDSKTHWRQALKNRIVPHNLYLQSELE